MNTMYATPVPRNMQECPQAGKHDREGSTGFQRHVVNRRTWCERARWPNMKARHVMIRITIAYGVGCQWEASKLIVHT